VWSSGAILRLNVGAARFRFPAASCATLAAMFAVTSPALIAVRSNVYTEPEPAKFPKVALVYVMSPATN